ncbi:FtsX-like permease family protein [Candidatus Uabimicrobium sp. HlEnr_7]|uniref:FtsX-like permease family protein n=1 Tax=Candidatus Uabimicrobium helgolandensis TaxID=3095367 RepID=UPI0035582293
MFSNKVPLSWLNLMHNKRKLLLSILGVTFAVVIMFVEVGFYLTFFDKNTVLITKLNSDLIMVSKSKLSLIFTQRFSRTRLYQAASVDGVYAVHPLYIERALSMWKNDNNQTRSIRAIAFDITQKIINIPQIEKYKAQLALPNTVLIDNKSRSCYGSKEVNTTTELANSHVQIVGDFTMGPDFSNHGNIIMSDKNFAILFQKNAIDKLEGVSLGLIQIDPDYDIESVQKNLQKTLTDDVNIYTRDEYEQKEKDFWKVTSPVGPIFLMGTVAGFLVGIIICYQILYSNVMSYLKQFATVKAFGFANRYLLKVVLQEALLLSIFGFFVAFGATRVIASIIAEHSSINITVDLYISTIILILTVVMCVVAGIMAARRAFLADPADLF